MRTPKEFRIVSDEALDVIAPVDRMLADAEAEHIRRVEAELKGEGKSTYRVPVTYR